MDSLYKMLSYQDIQLTSTHQRKQHFSTNNSDFLSKIDSSFSFTVRRKFRPYEWNHERNSLMNWELQDRIKATLERIETKRKISKTQHYTRLTESQKYDSFLSTWYCGEYGKIYLCVILTGEMNTKKNPNPVKYNKPVFRP